MVDFEYVAPRTVQDVVAELNKSPKNGVPMAGGTDLIVKMKKGNFNPGKLIDIKRVDELNRINFTAANELEVGAAVALSRVASFPSVAEKFPVLFEAIGSLGSVQVRNKGTLIGNICNASPAADTAPALLLYGAKVEITGPEGGRLVPICDFFLGPGQTVVKPGELVTRVIVPAEPGSGGVYLKLARRQAVDLAIIGVGALALPDKRVRIALGAVAPTPIRLFDVEQEFFSRKVDAATIQAAIPAIVSKVSPIDDIRASGEYRRKMVRILATRAVEAALERVS